ncbi:DUF898 domain-containing protein [Catenovulum sp. SM1970]|uniref:YjgN family protein n=1 Tax=Marinifaba aquimaris TaxID=2741323 RepID=UPI0015729210|nr:YjgN family protein [Marinifaba aquimaris]NTS75820.1 DUF898 domain-containing protein [Marinifaba aquimaris]
METQQQGELTPQHSSTSYAFQFKGKTGEFFRIWIVNLALTIVTLGIYSAWAKVRQSQYMCGNTFFDNHEFQYLATPMQILKGRLIAFALIITYSVLSSVYPMAAAGFMVALVLLMPLLLLSSLKFNYHNLSYRHVRFRFTGKVGQAYWYFLLLPILAVLPFGLLLPYAIKQQKCFIANNLYWGDQEFKSEPPLGAFYGLFLGCIGVVVVLSFVIGAVFGLGALSSESGGQVMALMLVLGPIIYLAMFAIGFVANGYILRFMLNNAQLADSKINTTHSPWTYGFILLSNTLAIIFSLGLAYPWAKIRMNRYLAKNITMSKELDLSSVAANNGQANSSVGQEVADGFDMEVGLGL